MFVFSVDRNLEDTKFRLSSTYYLQTQTSWKAQSLWLTESKKTKDEDHPKAHFCMGNIVIVRLKNEKVLTCFTP